MQALTFKQLVDDTLTRMGFKDDTGNLRETVKAAIRANHEHRATQGDYSFMRLTKPRTFTLVPGQQSYALSPDFRAPIYFRRQSDGAPLVEVKSDMLHDQGLPVTGTSGNAQAFEFRGHTNVLAQPLTASVVRPTSSAGGDNGRVVTIIGEDANGLYLEVSVTLDSATLPTTGLTFSRVDSVRKEGTGWVGTVTVATVEPPTAIVLARFPPASYGVFVRHLYLLTAPSAADVIEYDFWKQPNLLSNDYDLPSIPAPFSRLLMFDTLLDLAGFSRPTGEERQQWQDKVGELMHSMDSTYIEGQTNMANASYIHYVPR